MYVEKQKLDRILLAADAYAAFMDEVVPNWRNDPQAKDTPMRVAKSFVNDLVHGLHSEEPKITDFENGEGYDGIVAQCNIPVKSLCAHHHLPISGFAHVAYIPKAKSNIIGLSKLNRLVEYWSRRPQTQEHLTIQIKDAVQKYIPENDGVAVVIHASHFCCSHRGVHHDSEMHTAKLTGLFFTNELGTRAEFYRMIDNALKMKR
jgi:GTP cyclohydrolase IA